MLRIIVAAIIMGVILLSASSSLQEDPSVLLIVVDTLRGDRIGSAGYSAARTPVLDSLAQSGIRFSRAGTPAPLTLPAVSSLLTGLYPPRHGVRDNDRFVLSEDQSTLAELFSRRGYRTGAVLGSAVLNADRGLNQGFEIYDDNFSGPYPTYRPDQSPLRGSLGETRRRADTVTDLAGKMIRGFGSDPYFAVVHYFDVHMHYDPPPEFAQAHPGRPYDGEVSFVDQEIGRLLQGVPNLGNTLVIVVSDHGESQSEHGEPQHGFLLYESTLHVPFILSGPGIEPGVVRDDLVSLVDLAPSLQDQFGLGDADMDGRVLAWNANPAQGAILYAETLRPLVYYGWASLRAVRRGSMKLIEGGGRTEVYDLARDPRELSPLKYAPRDLKQALDRFALGDDPEQVRKQAHGFPDPGRKELLESLGYIGGDWGADGVAESRPHPADALPGWIKEQLAKDLLRRGVSRMERGEFNHAIALADSVLSLTPAYPEARYLRGECLRHQGKTTQAVAEYARGSESRSRTVSLCCRARTAELQHNGAEAYGLWRELHEVNPGVWEAAAYLSEWHMVREEHEQAVPYLQTLVKLNPEASMPRFDLALAQLRTGAIHQSRLNFSIWLENNPSHPRAREIHRVVQNLGAQGAADQLEEAAAGEDDWKETDRTPGEF